MKTRFLTFILSLATIAATFAAPPLKSPIITGSPDFSAIANKAAVVEALGLGDPIRKPLDRVLLPGAQIVVVGDSLSQTGYGLGPGDGGYPTSAGLDWPSVFSTFYTSGRATLTNTAVSGRKLADLVAAYATEVHPHRQAVTGAPQSILIDWSGANDLTEYPDAATYIAAREGYWQTAIDEGWYIFAATIAQRFDGVFGSDPTYEGKRLAFNAAIRESPLLATHGQLVDLGYIVNGQSSLTYDGVHFKDATRHRIARIFAAALSGFDATTPLTTLISQGNSDYGAIRAPGPTNIYFPPTGGVRISGGPTVSRILLSGTDGEFQTFPYFSQDKPFAIASDNAALSAKQTWKLYDAKSNTVTLLGAIDKATTGDPADGGSGHPIVINTFDKTVKIWAGGSWVQIGTLP